jgi:hypothetical protein
LSRADGSGGRTGAAGLAAAAGGVARVSEQAARLATAGSATATVAPFRRNSRRDVVLGAEEGVGTRPLRCWAVTHGTSGWVRV